MAILRKRAMALPLLPGVYIMHSADGEIIYIGKAKALRNRVSQYFGSQNNHAEKVRRMVDNVDHFEYIITDSEFEALILECSLIKQHTPKYNILLKDDKGYSYIKVSGDKWRKISYVLQKNDDNAEYIGPYKSSYYVKSAVEEANKIFMLPTCNRKFPQDFGKGRPCLNYHIKLCSAPCTGKVKFADYNESVEQALAFLKGGSSNSVKDLTKKMEEAAENLEFEKAAKLRDHIRAIQSVQQRQHIVSAEGDFDVLGMARDGSHTGLEIFYIRYGRMVGKENFSIPESASETDEEIITTFLRDFYGGNPTSVPKEIILPLLPEESGLLSLWLTKLRGSEVKLIRPERGFKRRLKDMAMANAAKYLSDKKLQWEYQDAREQGAVQKLKELLSLPRLPERMECFDISHNQGAETTGSMAVFEHGRPAKSEYRKFKLQTTQGHADDFKSMAEVMSRRYGKEKDWPEPDLIVLDGGLGQMHAAIPVIREAGCNAPVIGLAKRIEEIYVEGSDIPIVLDHHEPALQLLQFIRDEAHRFVITYHRKWTNKRNTESVLDHIEGIGPNRRNALWHAFRSLDEMKKASEEELAKVAGMNKRAAHNVYRFFHMRKDEKQLVLQGMDVEKEG